METARPFVHAAMMRQWLDDQRLVVEYEIKPNVWVKTDSPEWNPFCVYRFQPLTIRIGEFDVPAPLRSVPDDNAIVWRVGLPYPTEVCWSDNPVKEGWLLRGLLHSTKKAAEIHGGALTSFADQLYSFKGSSK